MLKSISILCASAKQKEGNEGQKGESSVKTLGTTGLFWWKPKGLHKPLKLDGGYDLVYRVIYGLVVKEGQVYDICKTVLLNLFVI